MEQSVKIISSTSFFNPLPHFATTDFILYSMPNRRIIDLGGKEMGTAYSKLWAELDGPRGWNVAKGDIKELVNDPVLWATN